MGTAVLEIAFFFGLHPNSVSRWFVKRRKGGIDVLKSRKAPGPVPKLSLEEANKILNCLKKPATDYGFLTPLWTCKRVKQLIQKEVGKSFTEVGVWKLLKRFGLTNKKPERRAIEQNPKEAKRWMKEEWPKILAHARKWQATLYFQDETGVSLTPSLGRTWAPRGVIPEERVTGKRGGFCISSVISIGGRMLFRVEKGRVNAKTFVDFLKKVMRHHRGRKMVVVTDQARPHVAKYVAEFVEANKKSFALYYLPPYSPELNPVDHVWGYLKKNKLRDHGAQSVGELKKLALISMWSIQRQKSLFRSFFRIYLT
ncbi:MAG: IS630 family transposase [Candidatus Hadarchaeales archaeon]